MRKITSKYKAKQEKKIEYKHQFCIHISFGYPKC